jgi:hypothetical protein
VVGGTNLAFDLLLHLMETVSPFSSFWSVLCNAEYDKQRQSEPISPSERSRLRSNSGKTGGGEIDSPFDSAHATGNEAEGETLMSSSPRKPPGILKRHASEPSAMASESSRTTTFNLAQVDASKLHRESKLKAARRASGMGNVEFAGATRKRGSSKSFDGSFGAAEGCEDDHDGDAEEGADSLSQLPEYDEEEDDIKTLTADDPVKKALGAKILEEVLRDLSRNMFFEYERERSEISALPLCAKPTLRTPTNSSLARAGTTRRPRTSG